MTRLSSHALAEVEGQSDRIVIMNQGHKVADGALSELRRLAALPLRVRVHLARSLRVAVNEGARPLADWTRLGERSYELPCSEQDKIAVLRQVVELPLPLDDVEIISPGLDELYAHYLRRSGT